MKTKLLMVILLSCSMMTRLWAQVDFELLKENFGGRIHLMEGQVYASSHVGKTYSSPDFGQTWTDFTLNGQDVQFVTHTATHKFAILTDHTLMRAPTGTENWAVINTLPNLSPYNYMENLVGKAAQTLYWHTRYGDMGANYYLSTDNGQSWQQRTYHSEGNIRYSELFFHPDEGTIYALPDTATEFRIAKSLDNGLTWTTWTPTIIAQAQYPPHYYNSIVFSPNGNTYLHVYTIVADAEGDLYQSIDGLQTMTFFRAGEIGAISATDDLALKECSISGCEIGTLSADGVWQGYQTGIGDFIPQMEIDDAGYLYYVTLSEIYRSGFPVSFTNTIAGRLSIDDNADCVPLPTEAPVPQWKIRVTDSLHTQYKVSNLEGLYTVNVANNEYTITPMLPNPLWLACQPSGTIAVDGNNQPYQLDFPMQVNNPCPQMSVSLHAGRLLYCPVDTLSDYSYYVVRCINEGTATATDAYVEVTLDADLTYRNSSIPYTQQNGNVYRFALGTLAPLQQVDIHIGVSVSCDVPLGYNHCSQATAYPNNCLNGSPYDNSRAESCANNTNSYDPNDITLFVEREENPAFSDLHKTFTYRIRFQNSGTDTAYAVMIKDVLSPYLDLSTLRLGVSSHLCEYDFDNAGKTVIFRFPGIKLPHEAVNEAGSQGFVSFTIAQKADNQYGTYINNHAAIFFDNNPPIATNISSVLLQTVSTQEPALPTLHIAPNPVHTAATLDLSALFTGAGELRLQTLTGNILLTQRISTPQVPLSLGHLPKGIYFLQYIEHTSLKGIGKIAVQ